MADWGAGHYEHTAGQIEHVAERVVELAGIEGGERVLDLGCGTGNAALAAARRGALVIGADPADRLLGIAHERAAAEAHEIEWVAARAEELPFEDGSFDVVISIFAAIFAESAEDAIAETLRVLRPDGEALITAWIPAGPIDAMVGVLRRAVAEATGGQGPGPNLWHDPGAIAEIAARHGASTEVEQGTAAFTGTSPEAYFELEDENHPMSIAMRPVLENAGVRERVKAEAIAVLREENEDPEGFRVSSPYRLFRLRPSRRGADAPGGAEPRVTRRNSRDP